MRLDAFLFKLLRCTLNLLLFQLGVIAQIEIEVEIKIQANFFVLSGLQLTRFLAAVQTHLRQLPSLIEKFEIIF